MILEKDEIQIGIAASNIKYYEALGYEIPRINGRVLQGTQILIKFKDLNPNSGQRINVQCDCCKKQYTMTYATYNTIQKDGKLRCFRCSRSNDPNRKYTGNTQYESYKYAADSRGYKFEITLEEFNFITSKSCIFCGSTKNIGIDRWDNKVGYIYSNCEPCCTQCNRSKHADTASEFVLHCKKVVDHLLR